MPSCPRALRAIVDGALALRVVGATTLDEYRKYIEKDPAPELRDLKQRLDELNLETEAAANRQDYEGQRRSNETHASTTDPDVRLAKKADGEATRLAYAGHVLTENRVDWSLTSRSRMPPAEPNAKQPMQMIDRHERRHRITLGADKGYDTQDFIADCRARDVTPHVARHTTHRRSRIDRRVTRHGGYALSQRHRKTRRGSLWLDQDGGRWTETEIHRHRAKPALGCPRRERLQPRTDGDYGTPGNHRVTGSLCPNRCCKPPDATATFVLQHPA